MAVTGAGHEISLRDITLADPFWNEKMELVRREVLPYQWDMLNDRVPDAAPSFCIHNFITAGTVNREAKAAGKKTSERTFTFRGFEVLPEDPKHQKDEFYGFVFQDSDLYKWLEAVAYSLTQFPDPELEALADEAIQLVEEAQAENGYLDTYYIIGGMDKVFTNLKDHHELYCMGHLIEAAVAFYEATGKDRLLRCAERYAKYAASVLGPEAGKQHGYPGHEIAEMALVRLYGVTREKGYLDLARYFVEERGRKPYYWMSETGCQKGEESRFSYYQAHLPVEEQTEAVGHAVRAMYLYSGVTDLVRLTGDEKLWTALRELWKSAVHEKMYITGGLGGTSVGEAFSFPFDLPNDLAYAETCASIGLVFWAWRMLQIEAKAEYADVMERTLYNTVLSGMALDGKSFFYVNPLEVLPEACHKDQRKEHVKSVRQKWFGCACCPPNLARTVMSVGKYAFTADERHLWVHLYIGGELPVGSGRVKLTSGFPWDGKVTLTVTEAMAGVFTFALRIPGWAERYELVVNGEVIASANDSSCSVVLKAGYLYVTKEWNEGDTITLTFPMTVKAMTADPRIREDIGKVAVMRGPLVYCLEEADNGKNLHLLTLTKPFEFHSRSVDELGIHWVRVDAEGERVVVAGVDETEVNAEAKNLESENLLYRDYQEPDTVACQLHYVPYYMWNNRGEGEMQVWTRV